MDMFSRAEAFREMIASGPLASDCSGISALELGERTARLLLPAPEDEGRRDTRAVMSLIDIAMRAALLDKDRFHETALASNICMSFLDKLPGEGLLASCTVVECDERFVGNISIASEAQRDRVACTATCTFVR